MMYHKVNCISLKLIRFFIYRFLLHIPVSNMESCLCRSIMKASSLVFLVSIRANVIYSAQLIFQFDTDLSLHYYFVLFHKFITCMYIASLTQPLNLMDAAYYLVYALFRFNFYLVMFYCKLLCGNILGSFFSISSAGLGHSHHAKEIQGT